MKLTPQALPRGLKIALLNPPHRAIGSRAPGELLPPPGLLISGGPLIDAGHQVRLINADIAPMTIPQILSELGRDLPDALLIGHSGSTSAHPVVLEVCAAVRARWPDITIVHGGVHPTCHWASILREAPQIDIALRCQCNTAVLTLMATLAARRPLARVPGIAFRWAGEPFATAPCPSWRNQEWFGHVRTRPLTGRPSACRPAHPG